MIQFFCKHLGDEIIVTGGNSLVSAKARITAEGLVDVLKTALKFKN